MSTVRQVGIKMVVDTQSVATEVPKAAHEFDALGASAQQASERATRGLDSVGQASQSAVSGMSSLTAAAIGVAGAAAVATDSLAKMVVVQREFDVLNSSLITVTGSSAAAEVQFDWIKRFAATTPYALNEVTGAFVKMKALGLDASEKSLASYGNTASAMGKGLDQMIEAVADGATGEFERLKEFGIKASQQGDQVSFTFKGITTTVGNNAAEITQYLQAIGEVDFAGAMEKRAATLDGAMSNLADSASNLLLTISQSGIGDAANRETRAIANEFGLATQAIEEARSAHGGMAEQLASGAGMVAGRTFFAALNTAVNATNWAVNTLSGGLLDFSTNVDLTNWRLKSTASQVAYLESELQQAGAKMAELQQKFAVASDNIYLKSEIYQLQLYIKELKAAKAQKELLMGKDSPENYSNEGRNWKAADESAQVAAQARGRAYAELMGKMATQQEKFTAAVFDAKEKLGDLYSPEIEKRLRDHYIKSESGVRTVSAAEKEALDAAMERRKWFMVGQAEYEKQLEAERQAIERNAAAAAKAEQANIDAAQKSAEAVDKRLLALKDENAAQALAAQQGVTLAQAIETITIARLSERQAALMREGDRDAEVLAIQTEIDARRKLRDELGTYAGWAAAAKQAKDVATEASKIAGDVERELTSALMRGFERGKGFAETLRDTVVNMFKTMVLRPVISAVVSPVAGAMTAGLGLPGAASAATANTSALSGLGMLGGSLGALGTGLGAGAGMIAGGGVGGWLTASTSLIGTGTAAGAMAGIGALAGPIGAALAVASLLKSMDDSGTMHTGGIGGYSAAGGTATGAAAGLRFGVDAKDYTASAATASAQIAKSIVGMLDSTATTFGQQAGYYAATAFADDTSKDGAWGALMLKLGDKLVLDWANNPERDANVPRVFANGEAGAKQYAAAVTKDVRDYLITQTPTWADSMLTELGDAPSLEQLAATVGQINATATALDGMGRASQAFANLAESATNTLITALGGGEAAVANLGSYYTNYYSQADRAEIATRQLTEQLATIGVTLPETRDAYRELVDDAMASGNEQLAADLIKLSGAYASVSKSADELTASMTAATSSIASYLERLDTTASSGGSALSLSAAQGLYATQLNAAKAGDTTAMGNLSSYADSVIKAATEQLPWLQAALVQGRVRADLRELISGARAFAVGGAFSGSVVSGPTAFDMGLMGEKGPEAVMPLANVGGVLGVRMAGGGDTSGLGRAVAAMAAEIKVLRDTLEKLGAQTVINTANGAASLARLVNEGLEVWNDPATPLTTEAAA